MTDYINPNDTRVEKEGLELLKNLVDEFGKKELINAYRDLEPCGEFPVELVRKISDMGLMGISFPQEYGGMGMNTVATSMVGERLAFYWPSLQLIWSANVSLAGFPIMTFGNEEQKERFLPRLASGEILGCYALTEPEAGSDAAAISARADTLDKKMKLWTLSGVKVFITNADVASVGVVFAKIRGSADPRKRIGAFIISSQDPGFRDVAGIGVKDIPKWGLKCCHFSEIILDNVEVKSDMILKGPNGGWSIAMETLNNGRINIAAQAVGIARRALYEFIQFAKTRKTFGKPLIENQATVFRLADFETRIEAAWLLTLEASRAKDAGESYMRKASMAKLFASETARDVASFCSENVGGIGYTLVHIAEWIAQDARATVIYEGASNIQRMIIAKDYQK